MRKLMTIFIFLFSASALYADTKYFAEVDKNNVVKRVVVADNLDTCNRLFGGKWIETFMDNPNKNYAGKGHDFYEIYQDFVAPMPYPSWVLDEKRKWKAPKAMPVDGKMYKWNEDIIDWKEVIK